MKILLTSFLLFPMLLSAQYKFKTKEHLLPASLLFLAGAADGVNQVLQFKYPAFHKAFPHLHNDWWNPKVSGANKYKNGKKEDGPKFPGSTSIFVGVTDGYHASRGFEHLFMAGAVAFKIAYGEKKKWYYYIIEAAGYWILNRIGFAIVYTPF